MKKRHRLYHLLIAIALALLGVGILPPTSVLAVEPAQSGLDITPGVYVFPYQGAGDTSGGYTFSVQNTSDTYTVTMAASSFIGDGGDHFVIQTDGCAGVTLQPQQSCTVQVAFTPKSPGAKGTTLYVNGSIPDGPMVWDLAQLYGLGVTIVEVTMVGSNMVGEVGDPITTGVGEVYFEKPLFDLGGPLPLAFTLHYASWMRTGKLGRHNDPFGGDFSHNYHYALVQGEGDAVAVQYGPGDRIMFEKSGGQWRAVDEEVPYQLEEDDVGAGYYYLLDPIEERVYTFEKNALQDFAILVRVEDRHGNTLTLANDDTGHVVRIEDGLGRSLDFDYDVPLPWQPDPYLVQVTDQAGRSVQFDYEQVDLYNVQLVAMTDTMGQATALDRKSVV